MNLAVQRQVEAEAARTLPDEQRFEEEGGYVAEDEREARRGVLTLLAIAIGIVGVVVALPVGPDVETDDLEAALRANLSREAPPSAGDSRVPTLSCVHPFTNTRDFTCVGKVDIALVPDAEFRYDIAISRDRCWYGTLDDGRSPSLELLPRNPSGCLK